MTLASLLEHFTQKDLGQFTRVLMGWEESPHARRLQASLDTWRTPVDITTIPAPPRPVAHQDLLHLGLFYIHTPSVRQHFERDGLFVHFPFGYDLDRGVLQMLHISHYDLRQVGYFDLGRYERTVHSCSGTLSKPEMDSARAFFTTLHDDLERHGLLSSTSVTIEPVRTRKKGLFSKHVPVPGAYDVFVKPRDSP